MLLHWMTLYILPLRSHRHRNLLTRRLTCIDALQSRWVNRGLLLLGATGPRILHWWRSSFHESLLLKDLPFILILDQNHDPRQYARDIGSMSRGTPASISIPLLTRKHAAYR